MQFDLFTFLASLFNFAVLLVLLRIFLFKRITRAMDEREQRISDRWDEAEQTREEAREKEEKYNRHLRDVEQEKQKILDDARREARETREEELEQVRSQVEQQRRNWLSNLEQDKQALGAALERDMAEKTAEAVRRTLDELAGADLLDMMVDRFLEQVSSPGDEVRDTIRGEQATIRSSSDLADDQKSRIREALESLDAGGMNFETDSSLICGLELRAGGSKVAWTIAGRMEDIEDVIGRRFTEASSV